MAFYDRRAADATAHAYRGQAMTRTSSAVHAKLLSQEMHSRAMLGNAQRVADARRRAECAIAALPVGATRGGAFSISLAEDPPYTATSMLLLGQHRQAETATHRVLTAFYPHGGAGCPENPSGYARTQLILGMALTGQGKLDQAHAAGSAALDSPRPVWPVVALAGRLDQALVQASANAPETRDYHQRYLTISGQPGRTRSMSVRAPSVTSR
ncbi:MAG: hypothetical protein HKP61_08445 [Dactylosporangium sp.]|nr:hypothetical protein [Dactylosporangium sp.]NNJ60966.1 hypothetical protein [Dactylosporangium sp.]